jgi:hypothetical protein
LALIRAKAVHAFARLPAVVLAAARAGRLEVDLLVGVLADIADIQVAGGTIKREAPGIAQPIGPDLGARLVGAVRPGVIWPPISRMTSGRFSMILRNIRALASGCFRFCSQSRIDPTEKP